MTNESHPSQGNKSGGKPNRKRSFRRRRDNKPAAEANAPRQQPPAKDKQEKALDKAQRERRDRRRRRRLQAKQDAPDIQVQTGTLAQDEELNRPSPRVVVYTHVIRPDVRDSYEFRSEHFSKVTRRLEDFKIDLTPFFQSVEEDERRNQRALAGEFDTDDLEMDEDWDDAGDDESGDEAGDESLPAATLAQSPTVEELERFDDTDPDAGDDAGEDTPGADSNR